MHLSQDGSDDYKFTNYQVSLLRNLIKGYTIVVYPNWKARLRDQNVNPVCNLTDDDFRAVRRYLVKEGGLFVLDKAKIKDLSAWIVQNFGQPGASQGH